MSLADALINHDLHQEGFLLSDSVDVTSVTTRWEVLPFRLHYRCHYLSLRTVGSIGPLGVDAEDDTVTD